jgi:hypothetical protein
VVTVPTVTYADPGAVANGGSSRGNGHTGGGEANKGPFSNCGDVGDEC